MNGVKQGRVTLITQSRMKAEGRPIKVLICSLKIH